MPEEDAQLTALLLGLEQDLMRPSVRADAERASALLDEDFLEIGKSGRRYDKRAILEEMRGAARFESPEVRDFVIFRLTAELVLVTYQTIRTAPGGVDTALRSSIWVLRDGQWRIRFHQGTPLSTSTGW